LYHQNFLGVSLNDQQVDELANIFSELVFRKVIHSQPIPGAIEFIKNIEDYSKYVISGTPDTEIKAIVESVGLSHYFIGVFGSPEKKHSHMKRLITANNLNPKECIFIGDALADYEEAEKNGTHFILVENSDNSSLFEQIGNIIKVQDLSDLRNLIKENLLPKYF